MRLLLSSPMCKQCKKCLLCILIEDLVGPLVGLSQRGGDFDLAHDRIVKHRSNFSILLQEAAVRVDAWQIGKVFDRFEHWLVGVTPWSMLDRQRSRVAARPS